MDALIAFVLRNGLRLFVAWLVLSAFGSVFIGHAIARMRGDRGN